jgi:hypothetical protein
MRRGCGHSRAARRSHGRARSAWGNNRVQELAPCGGFLAQWGRTGVGEFNRPSDVAADAQGNLYVIDSQNDRVQKLAAMRRGS